MTLASRRYVATAFIFLVLSTHPIHAARVEEADALVAELADTSSLVEELQRALQEDTMAQHANQTHKYIGETFASCGGRKNDFERRVGKLKDEYRSANEDGVVSIREAARVILKTRSMVKTLSKAEQQGCAWVTEKTVDKSALQELVSETAAKSRCFADAQKALEGVAPEDQGKALQRAMTIFLSEDCKAVDVTEGSPEKAQAERTRAELEADEAAEQMAEASLSVDSSKMEGTALLESAGLDPTEVSHLAIAPREDVELFGSLAQMSDLMGNDLGAILVKAVGFVVLLILWALFCFVMLPVLIMVIGLIMCIIKVVILFILHKLNMTESWDGSLGGCMSYWFGALYTDKGAGVAHGVALCASSMMLL